MDISHPHLNLARSLTSALGLTGRAKYVVADLAALPLPTGYFDAVVCNCVLEHLQQEGKALLEMKRVLKPQGRLFLTVDCLDRGLWLAPLDRLPPWAKRLLLKAEIASAPTLEQGWYENLDRTYGVVRRYRRQELVGQIEALGFRVVETRYYLTLLGALLFELLLSLKGLDITKGLGRFLFIVLSLLSAPLLVIFKDISPRRPGHGLALLAVKVP